MFYNLPRDNPTFRLMEKGALSGIHNLNPLLTLNSITVAPDFVYKGGDAGAINWTAHNYGETLTLQAGTSPAFNQGSPLLGSNDDSVKFNNGGYYKCGSSACGDIATEDFVVEVVIKHAPENSYVLNKGAAGGWRMRNTDTQLYMNLLGSVNILSSTVTSSWCHVIVFFDRSGSAIFYTNGAPGSAADISAVAGSASNGALLEICAASGSFPGGNNIAYMAMWKRDAWLDTHLQASVATERFYRLTGFYPQVAKGTALPTTATRATVAHLDKIESDGSRGLYSCGAGWLRNCSRKDSNDVVLNGALIEAPSTNSFPYSADYSQWTATRITGLDGYATPARSTDGYALITNDSVTDDTHLLDYSLTPGASFTHMYSIFVKAGDKTWAYLQSKDSGDNTVSAYFDLNTGTVGTTANTTASGIESWGNGWFRIWILYPGNVGAHSHYVGAAVADGDNTFIGGSEVDLYIWGAQHEYSTVYPSSYISTTGAAVTRNADVLVYKGDDGNINNNQQGAMSCQMLVPDHDNTANRYVLVMSDGAAATDRIQTFFLAGDDLLTIQSEATGGNSGAVISTTDVTNNMVHNVQCSWKENSLRLYLNGAAAGTPDTECNMPDDLDRINIGSNVLNIAQINGLVGNIQIYMRPTRR